VAAAQLLHRLEVAATELAARLDHRALAPVVPGDQLNGRRCHSLRCLERRAKGLAILIGNLAQVGTHSRLGIDVVKPRKRRRNPYLPVLGLSLKPFNGRETILWNGPVIAADGC
jgi:hypothetical protein